MMRLFLPTSALVIVIGLAACATSNLAPLKTADHVDLPRYMGHWYVIACIPTRLEKNAYDAVESYELKPDGRIATTFTLRRGSHEAPIKTYRPIGSVKDSSNAKWSMQFLWPFKSDYEIAYLDDAYSEVIVARQVRDYVWIMSRTPTLSEERYESLVKRVAALGYDPEKLRRIPQGG